MSPWLLPSECDSCKDLLVGKHRNKIAIENGDSMFKNVIIFVSYTVVGEGIRVRLSRIISGFHELVRPWLGPR